jgi:hypothetical protein
MVTSMTTDTGKGWGSLSILFLQLIVIIDVKLDLDAWGMFVVHVCYNLINVKYCYYSLMQ